MKFKVPEAVSKAVVRQVLVVNKNSPALMLGAGIAGMVGSTILACRATLKVEDVLQKSREDQELARNALEREDYDENDLTKDLKIIKIRTGAELIKLYAPAVVLGGVSIAFLGQSHNILSKRNAAISAAYAALDKGFNEYRQRVVEKYGEEEDRHLRYGTRVEEVVDEKGKKHKVTRVMDGEPSMYARFFDPLSTSWSKEPEYNLIFLKCQQNYANDLLKARGHVFLNEVYDMLGMERTKPGSVVGWVLSKNSDNFIDFGIYEQDDSVRDFVNGREGSILLDFNVDGVIFDKLNEHDGGIAWQMGR